METFIRLMDRGDCPRRVETCIAKHNLKEQTLGILSTGEAVTMFTYACRKNRLNTFRMLISKFKPMDLMSLCWTVTEAMRAGSTNYLVLALYNNSNIRAVEGCIRSSLLYIALENKVNTNILTILLDAGASPNQLHKNGKSPLEYALDNEMYDKAELLLKWGAEVNLKTRYPKDRRLLHILVKHNAPNKFFMKVLSKGANVNHQDFRGDTPLHLAIRCHHTDLASLLIYAGADVHLKNKNDLTPTELNSIYYNNEHISQLLEDRPFSLQHLCSYVVDVNTQANKLKRQRKN